MQRMPPARGCTRPARSPASMCRVSSTGVVTTLAGSGVSGFVDGAGGSAQFKNPQGLAVDASGNLYVADLLNIAIRKVTPSGLVTTIAH